MRAANRALEFFISPATKLAVCQPPYANSTGVIAAPKATTSSIDTGRSSSADGADSDCAAHNPAPTSATIAAIFNTINALCTFDPARTPKQFTTVSDRQRRRRDPSHPRTARA